MPTTLDLAGAADDEVDFRSLPPLFRREVAHPYAAIYGAYLDLRRCVIGGRHKLVLYPAVGRMRLFDLDSDPREVRDLSENSEFRPVIRNLLNRLVELRAQFGDELDLAEAFPDWFRARRLRAAADRSVPPESTSSGAGSVRFGPDG